MKFIVDNLPFAVFIHTYYSDCGSNDLLIAVYTTVQTAVHRRRYRYVVTVFSQRRSKFKGRIELCSDIVDAHSQPAAVERLRQQRSAAVFTRRHPLAADGATESGQWPSVSTAAALDPID